MDSKEQVAIHIDGFGVVQRCNYFGGEPVSETELELRVRKLRYGKTPCENEIRGEIVMYDEDSKLF